MSAILNFYTSIQGDNFIFELYLLLFDLDILENNHTMKRYGQLLLCTLLALGTISTSFAQLSKAEKKEWKKKAKTYVKAPETLKNLIEENQSLSGQVSNLQADNSNFQSRISDKDAKISEMEDDMTKLRSDLGSAKKEVREMKASATAEPAKGKRPSMKGVVFKVQIGAFRNKDLSKYFENNENFTGETDEDGTQKVTLGQFADYWEADTFKKYLREMGVKDAWIVPYKDGARVAIKDVLEGVVGEEAEGE